MVVMALDEYGHGSTDVGLLKRGYVNHRVKVNFGEESEAEGTFTSVGGPERFRLMTSVKGEGNIRLRIPAGTTCG